MLMTHLQDKSQAGSCSGKDSLARWAHQNSQWPDGIYRNTASGQLHDIPYLDKGNVKTSDRQGDRQIGRLSVYPSCLGVDLSRLKTEISETKDAGETKAYIEIKLNNTNI